MPALGPSSCIKYMVQPSTGLVSFWLSVSASVWWATSFLPTSFAFHTWSSVGDTCFGCLRNGWGIYVLYGLAVSVLVHVSLLIQDYLAKTNAGYMALPSNDVELPTQQDQQTSGWTSVLLRFSRDPSFYGSRHWILWGLRALLCLYWVILLTFLLRLQNLLGVRPCRYTMHQFTPEQQKSIGHDPAAIYVLFHAEGYPEELRDTLMQAKQRYAATHGYSFVTTKQLFGEWDYKTWRKQLPLMQGNSTFTVSQRSRVWGKTLAIHHVLFEADLQPKPQWVMWMDADAVVMRPELSAESLMFGMCNRVDTNGHRTADRGATLRCQHNEAWSGAVHQETMHSILQGSPQPTLMEDTPQLIAANVNSGDGTNFNSGVMLIKRSEWVRHQLALTWQQSRDARADQKSYGVYFKGAEYPSKVKILPGCSGANGYTANWRAGRWMWGDFIAHTIGYDIPVNKLHATRGLQEVADGRRHPLLLPPWIYTA